MALTSRQGDATAGSRAASDLLHAWAAAGDRDTAALHLHGCCRQPQQHLQTWPAKVRFKVVQQEIKRDCVTAGRLDLRPAPLMAAGGHPGAAATALAASGTAIGDMETRYKKVAS